MSSKVLSGKRIWITGASKGLGLAVTRELLQLGAIVFSSARDTAGLDKLVEAWPETCKPLPVDLTSTSSQDEALQQLQQQTDYLDILILNAGTCEYVEVRNFSHHPFFPVFELNVSANVQLLERALPLLRCAQSRAHIVGISSMVTLLPLPRSEAYGASKAAFDYLLESLRVDLYADNIDVSIVKPGFIRTPLTARNDFPMPFLMEPEAAAAQVVKTLTTRKYEHRFPWQLDLMMRALAWLPEGLKVKALQKTVRRE